MSTQPGSSQTANQNATPAAIESRANSPTTEESAPDFINLPQGKELNDVAALDLAKSKPTVWIVLAGPTDGGKTTLLTSLYELFQWNKVRGYWTVWKSKWKCRISSLDEPGSNSNRPV